jgi:hypothetical protein
MLRRNFLSLLAAPWVLDGVTASGAVRTGLYPRGWNQFVLGLYELPKVDDPWREVREAGCNLIRVGAKAEDFDQARDHKLRTWVSLGSISEKKRDEDEARIRGIVEQFQHDPTLLFWETEDEPAFTWKSRAARVSPAQIITTHDFVKRIDPVHPLYLNHAPVNLVSTLRKYDPGAEIIATDIYPVIPAGIREEYALWPDGRQGDLLNCTLSQVGDYTDKMRRVAGPSRAVFMVLQAFAWENLREKDRDPAMVLYPTRAELKSMAYQSIIHTADGLLFFGLSFTPPTAPLWGNLRSVLSELAQLGPELAAAPQRIMLPIEYQDVGHSLDRGIEWTARPSRKGLLLFTVNADPNPVDARITLPMGFAKCQVVGSEEVVEVTRGVMELTYEPFEAKGLRLT